jgi:choline dehydrogenase-like flavoprotein
MFTDGRQVADRKVIETDLCIIGGGPAGITIARTLAGTPLRVALIESGGFEEEPATQSLALGEQGGIPYHPLHETRFRILGGASNRWAGWCRPLDPEDLQEREWAPRSGWPLKWSDLEPYYAAAAQLCQLEHPDFDLAHWPDAVPPLYRPPFVGGGVETTVWQGSPPTKFGVVYRDELRRAANVTVYLHSNAVELESTPGAEHVTGVRVAPLGGTRFHVRARACVLTAGALETARLLLASNSVAPAGLGNSRGLVGRYFMEHPHVPTGRLRLVPREAASRPTVPAVDRSVLGAYARLALERPAGGIKCGYTLHPDVRRREKLLNYSAHLTTGSHQRRQESEAYRSLKLVVGNLRSVGRLAGQVRNRTLPAGLGRLMRNLLLNADEVAMVLVDEVVRRPSHLELYAQAEQSPNPQSRVTLSDARDAVGMPRLRLEWRMSEVDKRSMRRSQELIGQRLEAAGLGTLEPADWLVADDTTWGPSLRGGHHHLGTARMSGDPATGVVNEHGRVHDLDNLYVADSAVFPTGGYANPLLTIVALALRSADHLRSTLTR